MRRKDFLFSLIAAPVAFVAGVRSYRGVPPVVVPRRASPVLPPRDSRLIVMKPRASGRRFTMEMFNEVRRKIEAGQ